MEQKFFDLPSSASVLTKQVASRIKVENEASHFLGEFVKEFGYPSWSHTLTSEFLQGNSGQSRDNNTSNRQILFVPLVKDGAISAYIACVEKDGNISFRYYSKAAFTNYTPASATEKVNVLNKLALFGHFEKEIFNRDSTFFQSEGLRYLKNVTVNFSNTNQSGRVEGYYDFVTIQICQWVFVTGGWVDGGVGPDESPDYGEYEYQCSSTTMLAYIETGDSGGGGGGNGDPGNGAWWGGSGGGGGTTTGNNTLLEILSQQFQAILGPGDSYEFDNTLSNANSITFNSVSAFQSFLIDQNNNSSFDLSTPITYNPDNMTVEKARFNLTFIAGIDIFVKLNQSKVVIEVNSDEWGFNLGWSWSQSSYSQTTLNNEITLDVYGKLKYNIIVEGIGTLFTEAKQFRIKLNKTTGKITSISRIK